MKKIFCLTCLLAATLTSQAQKVTFFSPEFEEGVRYHIGLGEADDVLQTQTDTITQLSLSGLDITDIRDAVYLTAVEELDLSYNRITDVSPLLQLESLRVLDLSKNRLENIDALAFSLSERMEVDVSNNYIQDFSYFYTPLTCDFTFLGMGMQSKKDAPYFDLYQFYADVSEDGQPFLAYRGYTNMAAAASVAGGSVNVPAELDGDTHTVILGPLTETTMVTLSNGEMTEMTYVVPPATYTVDTGSTITIETGLPDDYYMSSAYAPAGTVGIVGNKLKYTAPDDPVSDVLVFSYYQGAVLKGYSRYTFNMEQTAVRSILATGEPFDIYTPAGVLVRSQTKTLKGLPRGVYIVNNQKLILR